MKNLFLFLFLLPALAFADEEGATYLRERRLLSNAVYSAISPFVAGAYFVDAASGSDTNIGTSLAPWATLGHAQSNAVENSTIYVLPGTYADRVTRGGVIFSFARGATVQTDGGAGFEPVSVVGTNIVITGEGSFVAANDGECITLEDGADLFIQARLIRGVINCFTFTTTPRLRVKDALVYGAPSLGTLADQGEIVFQDVILHGQDTSITMNFTVSGGIATTNPVNSWRSGDWVVNTNLLTTPQ